MPYIIRKKSRSGFSPYTGPTCKLAKVKPGKSYDNKKDAEKDARKLSDWNPVGFEAVKTPE
jgi:hypothetical protein